MSTPLEGIVRPFGDRNVFPTPFTKPGQQGSEFVRVAIGFQGSLKTIGYSLSVTQSTKMGQTHHEKPPNNSESLQKRLGEVAGG